MNQGQTSVANSLFLQTLSGTTNSPPPIWLMRQAGRYLPEYREVRKEAGSFLDLCYNAEKAAEVTMQPIRRYGFDAAILFADILLIPHALGQNLTFVEGEGPRLDPVVSQDMLDGFRKRNIHDTLSPVYETVARVRAELSPEKALIGFAGAPWTVATYMLAGGPMKDPAALRSLYYKQPEFLTALLDVIVEATISYLSKQVEAGANALQLFDTWAGGMPDPVTDAVCVEPMRRVASAIKEMHPHIPMILFPKGVGVASVRVAALPECNGIGIDYGMNWAWARENLSPHATVQGGLDPMLVVAGGKPMEDGISQLLKTFEGVPFIFNLGHGLTPDTPPENVGRLVSLIREGK